MTTDSARIRELENTLVLKEAEVAGIGSMLLDVQQDCVALKQQRAAIASLRHWGRAGDPQNLESLQTDLAYEKLMREHYGEVDTAATTFYPTPDAASIDELIVGLAKVLPLCDHVIKSTDNGQYSLITFIGYEVVCHLARTYREPGLNYLFIASTSFLVTKNVLEMFVKLGYTVGVRKDVEGLVPVTFVMPTADGITTSHREFKALSLDSIEENYTPEVVAVTRQALENIREASSGVLIINGEPGTGKSYLIRAILSELKERRAVVCTPPAQFLTQMDKLALAASFDPGPADERGEVRGSLMVMEDIGDLLAQDNVTHHLNETSNFLNLTDGLLSLLTNIVFIVSFNHDLASINPALTRPGRCLGQIKVGQLSAEQVQKLLGGDFLYGPCTLAEVYETRRTGNPPKLVSASVLPGGARARLTRELVK